MALPLEKRPVFDIICPVEKNPADRRIIAVIGERRAGSALMGQARAVGLLLARAGALVLTGGLGGVMEAASQGAGEGGGITIGVLPQGHRGEANRHLDIPLATGMGMGRNVIIAHAADGAVAVGGRYGTLSEIAFFLQLGKPVVGMGSWDIEGVTAAGDAREAVEKILMLTGQADR